MDRIEAHLHEGRGGPEGTEDGGPRQVADLESTLWTQFSEATTTEAFCQS